MEEPSTKINIAIYALIPEIDTKGDKEIVDKEIKDEVHLMNSHFDQNKHVHIFYDSYFYIEEISHRAKLEQMIMFVQHSMIDAVIVKSTSTLSDNLVDALKLVEMIDSYNVTFYSLLEGIYNSPKSRSNYELLEMIAYHIYHLSSSTSIQ